MSDRKLTFREAINEALRLEMRRDQSVILLGEDVAGGANVPHLEEKNEEAYGGPLGVTKGLMTEFGRKRVIDTPISESAHHGFRGGLGAHRVAACCRIDVYRFSRCLLRPDIKPGRQVPLYVRRKGSGAHGGAYDHRGGNGCRCTTFRRVLFCLHPLCGPESGCSLPPLTMQKAFSSRRSAILTPSSSVSTRCSTGWRGLARKGNTLFPWVWPM